MATKIRTCSIAAICIIANQPVLAQSDLGNDDPRTLIGDHAPEGVEVSGSWIGEYTTILDGGVRERTGVRHLLTFDTTLDLETISGLERTVVFAQILHAEPGTDAGSADAGDIQVFSNIEIDRSFTAIHEVWIEHEIQGANLRIKAGKVDANTEFATLDMLAGFSNSSAGFSPTIFALPSYPDPAFSVNVFWSPTDSITFKYGLYDGALGADGVPTGSRGPSSFFNDDRSNDWFHIAQADLRWDQHHGGGLSLGGWYHTGTFDRFDGAPGQSTGGLFATAHQTLWRDTGSDRAIELGLQYAWSDPAISEIEHHAGIGLVAHAPISSRSGDEAGIYLSWVGLSDEPGAGFAQNETAIDLYYAISLHPNATLRPEVQYILNPSGDPMVDDALVLGVRLELSF